MYFVKKVIEFRDESPNKYPDWKTFGTMPLPDTKEDKDTSDRY
ncbi:hypothetical protein AVEN_174170-1, partial [Araneus ventricosus]